MPKWTHDMMITMIDMYQENLPKIENQELRMKHLYRKMTQELVKKKYKVSKVAVEKKWVNMMHTYKRIKNRAKGGKTAKTTWEYYQVILNLLLDYEFRLVSLISI